MCYTCYGRIYHVKLSRNTLKDLRSLPQHIAIKLQAWIDDVGHRGLSEIRKIPGYHDEPLKGDRIRRRAIRLSRSYRAIYVIDKHKTVNFVAVTEVNKHEY